MDLLEKLVLPLRRNLFIFIGFKFFVNNVSLICSLELLSFFLSFEVFFRIF